MAMKTTMVEHVVAYLAERSMLGFRISGPNAQLLRSFADFADEQDCGTLTCDLVIRWARDGSRVSTPFTWAGRLATVKPFATYMARLDPATEFPATPIFGNSRRRLTPHIYTRDEILGLMVAARALEPQGELRPATFETLIGLIAATGLRISEAINLHCGDVDIEACCATVRMTKFHKSRYVPFHRSVAEALDAYLQIRGRFVRPEVEQAFFTVVGGQRLNKRTVHGVFQRLRAVVGIAPRGSYPHVRIHDLRHTFICRRLERWQAEGCDIDNAVAALSTYVGHAKVSDTYWYMTGIPELMAIAGTRFEGFTLGEGGHV
ncbi:MAG: tyrosine-type recombinase/integrase [Alphaproteobacteria bacterium]|nr:tyrosine-type recombinase/integrase [Alphaproteobacteria bacterium]